MNPYKPKDRIRALIDLRDHLDLFITDRNKLVIEYLKKQRNNKDYNSGPDLDSLSHELKMSKAKVGLVIRDLYSKCIKSFEEDRTLAIPAYRVVFCIGANARRHWKSETYVTDEKYLVFQLALPCVPRLGESISLGFIDPGLKNYYGHVHEVDHQIAAECQDIVIYADTTENFYFKWRELKEKTIEWDRWHEHLDRVRKEEKMMTTDKKEFQRKGSGHSH